MVIVKLQGGLGNQMFQYASALRLALKNSEELKLDISHYDIKELPNGLPYRSFDLSIFKMQFEIASEEEINLFINKDNSLQSRIRRKLSRRSQRHRYLYEPHFNFYPQLLDEIGDIYLEGYWQSEKYFSDIQEIVKERFRIDVDHSPEGIRLKNQIESTESVCLNIRRQEFASGNIPNYFVGEDYFYRAMELMTSKLEKPHFFIVSDELSWVKKNLKVPYDFTFIEESYYGNSYRNCLDLMKSCKHFVIPNSSFGWWAAWLSDNKNKIVIAPNKWLNDTTINTIDLIPDEWIQL